MVEQYDNVTIKYVYNVYYVATYICWERIRISQDLFFPNPNL